MPGRRRTLPSFLAVVGALATVAAAEDHPGAAVYRQHCQRCHGENGAGTDAVPTPLAGERSVGQLAALVDETMPEDDPDAVSAEEARQVAEWIHGAFYSTLARDRNRPARVDLARLTVRQHAAAIADLVGGFAGQPPPPTAERGLRGTYYQGRDFDDRRRVFERLDAEVGFDFGVEGPDPERFEPGRFAIRWRGSIVPTESGVHEFVVRTGHATRLLVNHPDWNGPALVDALVKSGDETEYRGSIHLLAVERPPQAAGEDRRQPPPGDTRVDAVAAAVARRHEQVHRPRAAGSQRGGQAGEPARHVAGPEHDEPVGPGAAAAQFQRRHGGDPAESDWKHEAASIANMIPR